MSDSSNNRTSQDWRTSATYEHLLKLDRAGWAWEFLRRNADYRTSVEANAFTAHEIRSTAPTLDVIQAAHLVKNAERWGLRFR